MSEALRKQPVPKYVSLMPTKIYGPNDNFDLHTSHVIPAMIRKFHEAVKLGQSQVTLWGTGSPRREFLHVDDAASAVLFALENTLEENLYTDGTGEDLSIAELADLIRKVTGHTGEGIGDRPKQDGTPGALMDVEKIRNSGREYTRPLESGLEETYQWFGRNEDQVRKVKF